MFVVDANILIAAQRTDHVHHDRCRGWLEAAVGAGERIALAEHVVVAFLRVVTHPGIFDPPTTAAEALGALDALLEQPEVEWLRIGAAQLDVLEELLGDPGAAGRLMPDTWLAAAAIAHSATLVTLDRDFTRFDGLRVTAPSGGADA